MRRPEDFRPTRKESLAYEAALRKIARAVGQICSLYSTEDAATSSENIRQLLEKYADALDTWAKSTAWRMLDAVNKTGYRGFIRASDKLGVDLRKQLETSSLGTTLQRLMGEQVGLIKSIPREAAERVQKLAQESLVDGSRASEIVAEIMKSGDVALSRATCIARTESARASSLLTQARAESIGATHFVWRCVKDLRTRKSHRDCDGKVFAYAEPPIVDGQPLVPGQIYNCRCYAEPIIPTPAQPGS